MILQDAISLINHSNIGEKTNAQWADLGCGEGLFTYALANLLQKGSTIYAIDKTRVALRKLPNPHNISIHTKQIDFTKDPLPADNLDGILMANSLHFVANKAHFITNAEKYLNNDGSFLIVEYDIDKANPWVPHPINMPALQSLFEKHGYSSFKKLGEIPSVYHTGNMYAALIGRY